MSKLLFGARLNNVTSCRLRRRKAPAYVSFRRAHFACSGRPEESALAARWRRAQICRASASEIQGASRMHEIGAAGLLSLRSAHGRWRRRPVNRSWKIEGDRPLSSPPRARRAPALPRNGERPGGTHRARHEAAAAPEDRIERLDLETISGVLSSRRFLHLSKRANENNGMAKLARKWRANGGNVKCGSISHFREGALMAGNNAPGMLFTSNFEKAYGGRALRGVGDYAKGLSQHAGGSFLAQNYYKKLNRLTLISWRRRHGVARWRAAQVKSWLTWCIISMVKGAGGAPDNVKI